MYAVFMILETQGYAKNKGLLFCVTPLLIYFLLMAILVYGNTLVLIPSLLQKKKTGPYLAAIVVLMSFYTTGRTVNQRYWDAIVWPEEPMSFFYYVHWNGLYAIWFTIISSMLFFTQKWYDERQQIKNIQISQLQTELKYLRTQVNPHFLFNGLNTIYGHIDSSNQMARNILLQFSDLLRYNLYEADVDWVDLEKETRYLQNYVALQRARSNSNVTIGLEINVQDPFLKIAPLLFIPFVENAFKFSTRDDANTIRIGLQQTGNRLIFECVNSYEHSLQEPGGIGLANVKRRLELLYKDRYTLEIRKEENTYSVQLILLL